MLVMLSTLILFLAGLVWLQNETSPSLQQRQPVQCSVFPLWIIVSRLIKSRLYGIENSDSLYCSFFEVSVSWDLKSIPLNQKSNGRWRKLILSPRTLRKRNFCNKLWNLSSTQCLFAMLYFLSTVTNELFLILWFVNERIGRILMLYIKYRGWIWRFRSCSSMWIKLNVIVWV